MTSITATALRKNLYNTIARVNEDCTPIAITTSKGKGAVLIGEDDWAAIEETLYLLGILWPKVCKPIQKTAFPPPNSTGSPCAFRGPQ